MKGGYKALALAAMLNIFNSCNMGPTQDEIESDRSMVLDVLGYDKECCIPTGYGHERFFGTDAVDFYDAALEITGKKYSNLMFSAGYSFTPGGGFWHKVKDVPNAESYIKEADSIESVMCILSDKSSNLRKRRR
jgi:hypothetical protein